MPHIQTVIILLFGPPGCGKSIQAEFIANRFAIPAISTGEMFRSECRTGTELGRLACSILSRGGLIGDDIVNAILARRIGLPEFSRGFLLDGYPRTLPQARFLDRTLQKRDTNPVVAIHLDVPFPVIVQRITSRRQCPRCSHIYNQIYQPPKTAGVCDFDGTALITREDDRGEIISRRLGVFEEQTGPVISHYMKTQSYRIDGSLAPAEVSARIEAALNECSIPV